MDNFGIGHMVALLTAAGVMFYTLGFIGLANLIRRRFTRDLSNAWYAVSTVY
jgi:hypothetical protein